MESSTHLLLSRSLFLSTRRSPAQFQILSRQSSRPIHPSTKQSVRHASSNTAKPNKPIILEQPDKFRPPSHPQRLNARRTTAPLMGGYNQGTTAAERQAQRTRTYPHMFPNEGTVMYRFLTNKMIHVWISLGVLTTLAIFTLTTSFTKTSPFAHLLPPLSTLPFHPITYFREYFSIIRLHIDYTTEQTAQKRQQAIQDAQKRRVYRRAHGMEDLNAAEDVGVDVRGVVEWDDGLTAKERENGGGGKDGGARRGGLVSGQQIFERGGKEAVEEARRRVEEVGRGQRESVGTLEDIVRAASSVGSGAVSVSGSAVSVDGEGAEQGRPQRRKVKRWFGIWE